VSVLSTEEPIRVLVDHYHDSGGQQLRSSLRGGALQATICRERLTWRLLKRYHVAIVDATAPAKVAASELRALERFVSEGGGLLLAGAAPAYEFAAGAPPAEMPAARIAERFGFRYASGSEAAGETRYDRDFRLGYRAKDAQAAVEAVPGFGPTPPAAGTWAPIEAPSGAQMLLSHRETGETLAAVARHGAGRVCVCGTTLERFNVLAHLHPLIAWLAEDAGERPGREIPTEIGPPPVKCTFGGLALICDEPLADRAPDLSVTVRRFDEFMTQMLGEDWKMPQRIRALRTCQRLRPWDHGLFLAPPPTDWATAYNVAFSASLNALWHSHYGDMIVALFPEACLARYIAIRFLEHLGFDEQAARLREIALRRVDREDPSRTAGDLARIYWATEQWHPKGLWLLGELERRYGRGFLRRLLQVLPKKLEDDRLPQTYAWQSDQLAYYLGLAAGEDVTGLLREIGTTIHPLPLVSPDDGGFDEAMRGALSDAVLSRAGAGSAGRRMEALSDLAVLKPEQRAKLPDRVRDLTEAFERSVASDARAGKPLERLARAKDASHAAWAALQLVSMGRTEWADRLAELLPGQDLRFRLMAGHALSRIGREVPEGTLAGLQSDGRPVGELDVQALDTVMIHPKVEGYEVANVLAESGLSGFPHGNWATRFYVYWVHTSPQWRRSGLSRLAFRAAMEHPEALRCSCFALNTGTRNNAHALYRDFGYVDMDRREKAVKELSLGTPCVPPEGGVVRPITPDDREPVRRFLLGYHEGAFTLSPLPVPELGEGSFTALAERDGKLVGVALARHDEGGEAGLIDVAVSKDEKTRAEIGVAMLARVHAMLSNDGAKRVTARVCSDAGLLTDVLCRSGYSREATGSVNMFGIRDLRQLFSEIRPLYERRLRGTPFEDWRGRVILLGDRLGSGLEVEDGAAHVLEAPHPGPTDIVLHTTDETITRVVTGRETPLEGYLQRVTSIEPQVSPLVMKLLETLFPEVPFVLRWGW